MTFTFSSTFPSTLQLLSVFGRFFSLALSLFISHRCWFLIFDPDQAILEIDNLHKAFPTFPVALISFRNENGTFASTVLAEEVPIMSTLHFVTGIVFMAIAPLQFIPLIRQKSPVVHRWLGYLFLLSSLVLSVSGVGFTFPFTATSFGGFGWDLSAWVLGLNLPFTGVKALLAAWKRDFRSHREWMLRHAFAGYAIPLLRWSLLIMAPFAQHTIVSSLTP